VVLVGGAEDGAGVQDVGVDGVRADVAARAEVLRAWRERERGEGREWGEGGGRRAIARSLARLLLVLGDATAREDEDGDEKEDEDDDDAPPRT
tara:strand:- start:382 stop:660 length:279 start_codon:yes stop_codon:yes gene_type:complete